MIVSWQERRLILRYLVKRAVADQPMKGKVGPPSGDKDMGGRLPDTAEGEISISCD
jgi:hypothetical protein